MPDPAFTLIVPAYNEEGAILETIQSLRQYLTDAGHYELLVVNDGSTDRTREILEAAAKDDPGLSVVHHSRNSGYGSALKTGVRRARGEYIVITDADGTYPNHRIPELVAKCREGWDMVVGARTGDDVTYPLIRKIPKTFLKAYASWIARQPIPDINSGLRVFRRDLTETYLHFLPGGFSFTTTITLAMLTSYRKVLFVPIDYHPRIGKSKIKPVRDTLNFVQLIARTGMYFAPVRVLLPVIALSFFAMLLSLGYDMFMLDEPNLTDKTVTLFMLTLNSGMFALLADMIDKRSRG
ncbi:MAG: glycosyltransferase family 2 protein [Phycisphaeraceae bacterium]